MSTVTAPKSPTQKSPLTSRLVEAAARERSGLRRALQPLIGVTAEHPIPASPPAKAPASTEPTDQDAQQQAAEALARCSHLNYARLRIDGTAQRIILRGEVRSFFHKQLAQEALMQAPGIDAVCNQLQVR